MLFVQHGIEICMTGLIPAIDSYTHSQLNVVTFSFMSSEILFTHASASESMGKTCSCVQFTNAVFVTTSHTRISFTREPISGTVCHMHLS